MKFSEKLKFEHEDEIIKPGKKNLANMVIDGDLDCANSMANGSQEGRVSDKKNYYDSRVHRLHGGWVMMMVRCNDMIMIMI